jgi:hypothetical protein
LGFERWALRERRCGWAGRGLSPDQADGRRAVEDEIVRAAAQKQPEGHRRLVLVGDAAAACAAQFRIVERDRDTGLTGEGDQGIEEWAGRNGEMV